MVDTVCTLVAELEMDRLLVIVADNWAEFETDMDVEPVDVCIGDPEFVTVDDELILVLGVCELDTLCVLDTELHELGLNETLGLVDSFDERDWVELILTEVDTDCVFVLETEELTVFVTIADLVLVPEIVGIFDTEFDTDVEADSDCRFDCVVDSLGLILGDRVSTEELDTDLDILGEPDTLFVIDVEPESVYDTELTGLYELW